MCCCEAFPGQRDGGFGSASDHDLRCTFFLVSLFFDLTLAFFSISGFSPISPLDGAGCLQLTCGRQELPDPRLTCAALVFFVFLSCFFLAFLALVTAPITRSFLVLVASFSLYTVHDAPYHRKRRVPPSFLSPLVTLLLLPNKKPPLWMLEWLTKSAWTPAIELRLCRLAF